MRALYCTVYAGEPFVQVLPAGQLATVRHVANSNRCAISITPADPDDADGPDYIVVAAIDNLVKGASGQAIQSYNVAGCRRHWGCSERAGSSKRKERDHAAQNLKMSADCWYSWADLSDNAL